MYAKRTKLIGVILAVIMLMQVVCTSMTSVVQAVVGENETEITFTDEKLYTAIKEALVEKIKESNDESKKVTITNISTILSLDLSGKSIKDLAGIEEFKSLKELNLFDNKIQKIDALATLTNLETLNLTNNNIEDCSVLEGLTKLTSVSIGSEDLEKVAIINAKDIVETNGVKSFEYALPQIFKYIYNKKSSISQEIGLKFNIINYVGEGLKDKDQYNVDIKNNKLVINIEEQGMATIEIKYNSGIGQDTCLVLHIVGITDEEKCGIKFEDENLYNAVKKNISLLLGDFNEDCEIDVHDLGILSGKKGSAVTDEYKKYDLNKDGEINEADVNILMRNYDKQIFIKYDNILTLVINKHYLYKDITNLDLVNKQIKNLEGLQYFVALSDLDLSNNFIDDTKVLKEFATKKADAETDLKNILTEKIATLNTLVEKKEEYNDLLSEKGRKEAVNKKINEIKTYINNFTEEQMTNDDKSNLQKYFSNNIQADFFTTESVFKNLFFKYLTTSEYNNLTAEKKVEYDENKLKYESDKTKYDFAYLTDDAYNSLTVEKKAEYDENKSKYESDKTKYERVSKFINGTEIEIGQVKINNSPCNYYAKKDVLNISGTIPKNENGTVTERGEENGADLTNDMIGIIDRKFRDIELINQGQCEQEGTWVDISAKRAEVVTAIGKQIDSIVKYYDIENLLLILPKEYLEYENIELNNLSLYEKKELASNIITKFIEKYDTLTAKEIEKAGSITKPGLETIKNQITDASVTGYIGNNSNELLNYITNYIEKQRKILTEEYSELYESSSTIPYSNYINEALKEISDTYINDNDDEANRKDVKSIISRMANVNTEETVSLPKIKHVDLSSNSIQEISGLTDMATLLTLNLCDNVISDLSTTDFTKFEKLYDLDLSHNRIYNTQIRNIKNLINLNLSNNYITNTDGMDFKLFVRLQKVDLSGNRIYDLKDIMYNLYELSKTQKTSGMTQILTCADSNRIPTEWSDFKEFGYIVDINKVNFKGQQIWATAKNKIVQDKVEYIHLPEIFNQAKYIDSWDGDTSTGTDLNNTTFLYAKATNDGMVLYLDTGRLGEQSNSASIEGAEIAAGTICTVNFTVATQAEIDEILATGVQIQLEKTLTDNENANRPDFNNDGKVNSDDLNILNKVCLGSQTISEKLNDIAKNIVPDNIPDIKDQLLLSKYVSTGWDDGKLTDEQREKAEVADITGDNKVEDDDFIVLANYLIGGVYAPYTEAQIIAKFDINGDGKVTEKDAICLSRYLVSKSTEKINIDTLTLEMLNNYKQSKQLHAKISPDNTTQKDIEWVSHDERIVRVDSTGNVTAVGTGTTQITAKSTKNANVYDTISVTVSAAADIVENIAIKDINTVKTEYYVGQEIDLTNSKVILTKRSGQEVELDITKEMIKGFDTTTQTTEPRIITVEYTDEFETTVQTSFTITVVPFVGEDTVNSIILVPPTKLEYNKGEDLDLTGSTVEKVMESGIKQEAVPTTVEMISGYDKTLPGEQTITVTYEGKTATFNVMVNNPVTGVALKEVKSGKIATELSITEGADPIELEAVITPDDAVNKNVTWSSSNENIATIDNSGKVTIVGVGEAIITVKTVDGEKTAACKVIVKEKVYKTGTGYIANISPNTNEAEFLDKLNAGDNCKVVKSDGVTLLTADDKIATGYKLVKTDDNGTIVSEISTLVVKGDINGDGDVDGTDATAIIYHINGKKEITNEFALIAADTDLKDGIDMTDYTRIIYHYIGIRGYIL